MSRDKLSVQLFHGRNEPDEQLDDWGFDGPCLGPFDGLQITYGTLALFGEFDERITLPMVDDLVLYDGKYYGDVAIRTAASQRPTAQVDKRLAESTSRCFARTPIVLPEKVLSEYLRRVEVFVDSIRELAGDKTAESAKNALFQVATDKLRP